MVAKDTEVLKMNRRLRSIGLLADPDELDRYLNQRQPLVTLHKSCRLNKLLLTMCYSL